MIKNLNAFMSATNLGRDRMLREARRALHNSPVPQPTKKAIPMGAKQSPEMTAAKKLVLEKGFTQYAAAAKTGITRGAISKSRWYREHKEALETKEAKKVAKPVRRPAVTPAPAPRPVAKAPALAAAYGAAVDEKERKRLEKNAKQKERDRIRRAKVAA